MQFVLSTKDYKLKLGLWDSPSVGFGHFRKLFGSEQFWKLLRNTIRISVLRLVCGFFPPIILSILLFDMGSAKFRKVAQSILYIPHFFSLVILYAIVLVLFQYTGFINAVLELFGVESKQWLMDQDNFLPILIGSGIWKDLGWGTIIYLATLTSIDPTLFEAAKLDGAGPLQRIRYVTLPSMRAIIVFQLIMAFGSILGGAGTEQIMLFYSPVNYEVSDVIGTWVYRQCLGKLEYGLGAAVSVFESTVGLVLVLITNKIAQKKAGLGLW